MSAIKDSNQNTTFIFSNFYHLYRKQKLEAASHESLIKGIVLRPGHFGEPLPAKQAESLKTWTEGSLASSRSELVGHLRSLRDARKRLNYLLTELDELLKQK